MSEGATYGSSTSARRIVLARGARAPLDDGAALTIVAVAGDAQVDVTASTLLVRFQAGDDGGITLTPSALVVRLHVTPMHSGAVIDLKDLPGELAVDALLLCLARPGSPDGPTLASPHASGRRTFIVSTLGWHAQSWFDGPLAHVLPDGRIASYVPTGGPAALAIPMTLSRDLGGSTADDAARLEGTAVESRHRQALAAIDDALPEHAKALALGATVVDLRAAIALALARQARPDQPIAIAFPGGKHALPPAWRRLTENAAIVVLDAHAARRAEVYGEPVPLAELSRRLAGQDLARLAQQVNSISEILPKSIL